MSSIPQESYSFSQKFGVAAFSGAFQGVLGLIVEHPFDMVKTRQQAYPHHTFRRIVSDVSKNEGIRGFYSGFVPNSGRVIIKQLYRWPAMLLLPPYFAKTIPESWQKEYSSLPKVATGLTIATFESYVTTPLERLKVYLMTSEGSNKSIRKFLDITQEHRFTEFFRGSNAMFPRQLISWVTFLVSDEKLKNRERTLKNSEELSFASLMKVALLVGVINTLAIMPFDMVKTNLQKSDHVANSGLFKTMRQIQSQYGFSAFYRGWQVKMAQYMINSAFSVTALDLLEAKFKKMSLN